MSNLLQILIKPGWEQLPWSLALWLGLTVLGTLLAVAGWRLSRMGPLPPQRQKRDRFLVTSEQWGEQVSGAETSALETEIMSPPSLANAKLGTRGASLASLAEVPVPWNTWAVLVVWTISLLAASVFAGVLLQIGFFHWLYGPGFSYARNGRPVGGTADPLDTVRLHLWAAVIAFPFQVAAIVGFLRSATGARLYQLGLTTARAGQNALLGFLAWLAVLPAAYFFHALAASLYQHWTHLPPEPHALERLVEGGPSPAEWVLVIFSAVVLAPILEELLFRGILQPWLALRPGNADMALGATLALVLFRVDWGWSLWTVLRDNGLADAAGQVQPVLFVVLMGVLYLAVRGRQRSPVPGAIFGSSLLFAAFHENWPNPIPLFVLALALGYLAYRTQSLVGPMVLHALFNGFACALLILGLD